MFGKPSPLTTGAASGDYLIRAEVLRTHASVGPDQRLALGLMRSAERYELLANVAARREGRPRQRKLDLDAPEL
jgi:hypothetical protein